MAAGLRFLEFVLVEEELVEAFTVAAVLADDFLAAAHMAHEARVKDGSRPLVNAASVGAVGS